MASPRENPFTKGPQGRTSEQQTKTIGKGDQQSRQKAEKASEQANTEIKKGLDKPSGITEQWPTSPSGKPLIKAEMAAAELVPTGQYANVSIGPVRMHFLIDPDRKLAEGQTYFSDAERATIAAALNEAAEIIEGDVVAVQRNLVIENMQQQLGSD